jgi:ABC-2 type transport system permease protein
MTESISNSSFAIYLPRFTGTIFEVLSAPVSWVEVVLGYVGAAATKSVIIGSIIFITANFFVTIELAHPLVALLFLLLTSISFCLFGFILGVWADGWEKLTIVPILVIMPLTFLGGTFYSISMLPPAWQAISLFNPLVYLISGFRWSFYENADVSVALSIGITMAFLAVCLLAVHWIFKTGYRLRT